MQADVVCTLDGDALGEVIVAPGKSGDRGVKELAHNIEAFREDARARQLSASTLLTDCATSG
jgi:hypothetical protein